MERNDFFQTTCVGDSGGAVFWKNPDGRPILMGILSRSKNADPFCSYLELMGGGGFFASTAVMIPGAIMSWFRTIEAHMGALQHPSSIHEWDISQCMRASNSIAPRPRPPT